MSAELAIPHAPSTPRRQAFAMLKQHPEWICVPALFVLVVAVWEIGFMLAAVPIYIAPAPSDIFHALVNGLSSGLFISNGLTTLAEALLGFLLATILGIMLGAVIAQSRFVEKTLYPYLIAIQTTPKVAIAPLFIIWFGFGMTSKVIMAAVVAFFPILVNVIVGLRSTDTSRIELMRSLQASRWQIFTMVRLPSAAPMIFAGLHIAVIFSVLGAIVGEFVGSRKGLGNLIMQLNNNLDTAGVFAALVVLSAMGIVLHLLMHMLQKRLLFWSEQQQIAQV
ncbi:ABC transporter permease [Caballeronia sp. LZ065]|uniref:ABC transporter permease n=1 Tax=Caballeronia sp. LZ065 TaxID=3038571 RepID=UPI00286202B8|nr:ABC transporter permease [Caballeronia sp. LZ065]MDR5781390.1 ABC transporter permease [Caballeronia sp. LZ065]